MLVIVGYDETLILPLQCITSINYLLKNLLVFFIRVYGIACSPIYLFLIFESIIVIFAIINLIEHMLFFSWF